MMRLRVALIVAPILTVASLLAVWQINARTAVDVDAANTSMGQARLSHLVPPPVPRLSRTMYAATSLANSTAMLDRCAGPVAVDLGSARPTLVSEHDYCGGSSWISQLVDGDAVQLSGEGVDEGLYVVRDLSYETRHSVYVDDLPAVDVVLQTCVSKTRLVLVALVKYEV